MTNDMFCFLSSQSDSFLIHGLLLVCSHSNTTGATSRVEQHLSPYPVLFTLVIACSFVFFLLGLYCLSFSLRYLITPKTWNFSFISAIDLTFFSIVWMNIVCCLNMPLRLINKSSNFSTICCETLAIRANAFGLLDTLCVAENKKEYVVQSF